MKVKIKQGKVNLTNKQLVELALMAAKVFKGEAK